MAYQSRAGSKRVQMLLGANATKPQPEKQPQVLTTRIPLPVVKIESFQRELQALQPKAKVENKQALFDLFERPPKAMLDQRNTDIAGKEILHKIPPQEKRYSFAEKIPQPDRVSESQHKQTVVVEDQNNPLKSERTQNYITEKLLEHRQNLIDTYGSSKVPTPVLSVIKPMMLSSDDQDITEQEELPDSKPFDIKDQFMNYYDGSAKPSNEPYVLASINRDR